LQSYSTRISSTIANSCCTVKMILWVPWSFTWFHSHMHDRIISSSRAPNELWCWIILDQLQNWPGQILSAGSLGSDRIDECRKFNHVKKASPSWDWEFCNQDSFPAPISIPRNPWARDKDCIRAS
jgi:hypothetical protein